MLSRLDWLRHSQSGAELLATLRYLAEESEEALCSEEPGPPHSALSGPCHRCWIYPRASYNDDHCQFCKKILTRSRKLSSLSREALLIWGFVNQVPYQVQNNYQNTKLAGVYIHDNNRFLVAMPRRYIKVWLQDMIVRHGSNLKGLLQIFPTAGSGRKIGMGDILCRAIHHEANLPMDRLYVRFFAQPHQLIKPHERDKEGILSFEVSEFLALLDMAEIFRSLIKPKEQNELYELLGIKDPSERQFYWGRLLGLLNQNIRDMLTAWNIRNWSSTRVKLLYELFDYVIYSKTG